ncbi:hypothetical protein [Pseudomonas sp. UBA1879]|uniref:hypothetical protein n=1 Tax=Pseudomonas sp. UBA1879 TaxID=1947305 RepID=UPI0025DF8D30|nr:hypothetical protein [Pseudomonas sp. UBA1879]
MELERIQYYGRFNVRFQATRVVIMPEDVRNLRSLQFCDFFQINWKIHDVLVELYDRMLAQKRPCEMIIAVSDPLTRDQAERINDSNDSWAVVAAAVGRLVFPAKSSGLRKTAGVATGFGVRSALGTRHAGDVLVDMQAWVNGGIGPQHSAKSMLIEAQGGVPTQ